MSGYPVVYDYSPNREGARPETRGVVIHSTRSGRRQDLSAEYRGTVAWFKNPSAQVNAHAVVGPAEITIMVPHTDVAWHARECNRTHLGIEVCQALPGDDYTDFQYAATAFLCRAWAAKFGFPLRRVMTQTTAGLIGHEDAEAGRRDGKSDPGAKWDWARFVALCNFQSTPTDPNSPASPDADAPWRELVQLGRDGQADLATLIEVSTPGNTAVGVDQALTESYRIAGLLDAKADRIRELVAAIKGG